MLGRALRRTSEPSGKRAQSPAAIGWWLNSAHSPPRAPFGQRKMLRTTSMTETACFGGSAMVALRRDSGDAPPGPGKNREAKAPRPSVEARVAAAALRLQQAGELNAAEALLMLVAGDAAPPAAELMLVAGDAAPPAAEQNELGDPRAGGGKWHADAKRLRVDGLSVREIADRIGR